MKRINIIILLFVGLIGGLASTSCKKSFLEKPKGGSVTVDTIFDSKNQAQYAIAEMYYLCVRGYFPQTYDGCRPEAITDQLYIIHPAYDWASNTIGTGSYITGNMSADANCDYGFGADNGPGYGWHYKGIRQANLVLKNINKVADADANWKTDVKGQALFCRAMQHFEAFRYYGGIPIVNKPLDGDSKIAVPRSSVQSVVDSVVKWCDQAASMLPATRASADFGKVTKLAALALKARILLYAASPLYNTPANLKAEVSGARFGDGRDTVLAYPSYDQERWNKAAKAAKDVIDNAGGAGVSLFNTGKPLTTGETYATLGDYESVWNVFANQELILVNTANQAGSGFVWGQYLSSKLRLAQWGVKNNVPVEFIQQYEKMDGTKWTLPATGADLPVDMTALNLDPRFYQTIAYDGKYYSSQRGVLAYYKKGDYPTDGNLASSDAGVDGYATEVYKFVARVDNMTDNHLAWPVFRLAEFYLSYAEALNEYQGPGGDATNYLNLIRKRAGMPEKHPADPSSFRDAIQNERTIELAYEGHRYNDLNRWLKAKSVLNGTLHGIQTTARKGTDGQLKRTWQVVPFVTRVFPPKYYYVPFPSKEISLRYLGNKSWDGQNPGW
ncbi:RagB/SusD family nutrient uptake outer membrane protein [Mucilaginibacter sp. HC2]|uniref:RagB/SusD family nutrient uptake outer membrane protein n=1 Tax=Mucilaginibacter inviolabilis TaxID=2714892 RepID=UPI00140A9FCD|nr:RagB/SusD family nutrient uptake outer membrane protein [Mucilaginibacter inviolabilis]NHA05076.1 RagB/SusD family nutrient uptake outer membrane protein [Mucilaginibacter inviolabilis]